LAVTPVAQVAAAPVDYTIPILAGATLIAGGLVAWAFLNRSTSLAVEESRGETWREMQKGLRHLADQRDSSADAGNTQDADFYARAYLRLRAEAVQAFGPQTVERWEKKNGMR